MQSVVVNGRTEAFYLVYPMMKNKILPVFSGNTYKVLKIVLSKPLFGMQIRQTGLIWFPKSQFA